MRPMLLPVDPRPSSLPRATRTAGAIWQLTLVFLSSRARHTGAVSFLTTIAPVGQTAAHCPQPTQFDPAMFFSNTALTFIPDPRWAKSMAPTAWISLHIRTQSPQSMHLL